MSYSGVRAFKGTFWNTTRVEAGMSMKDTAEALGYSVGVVARAMSGQDLPSDDKIVNFCNLFDVDLNKGAGEFNKAHREWRAQYEGKGMVCKGTSNKQVQEETPIKEVQKPTIEQIAETLYGKLSYAEFQRVFDILAGGEDIYKALYGKVDFDTYNKVAEILKEV